jgi:hypothetical protein
VVGVDLRKTHLKGRMIRIFIILWMEGNYLVAIIQKYSLVTSSLIFFHMFPAVPHVGGQGAFWGAVERFGI